MNPKPVVLSDRALVDLAQIVRRYTSAASTDVARSFVRAAEDAFQHLSLFPASGSTRLDLPSDWPELSAWPLTGFPYLLFYAVNDDTINIYRILHTARDIPASLTDNLQD